MILLDINLPDIDGYEVAHRLRTSPKTSLLHTPIIAITANALKGDAEKALAAGCDVYMSKPINIRELWAWSKPSSPCHNMKTIHPAGENMDTIKSMSQPMSYISRLECSGCGKEYSYNELHTFCPICQSPLLPIYDLKKVRQAVDREEISHRNKGMWRWTELLPVLSVENQVFLGEGDTPLLALPQLGKELGLTRLFVKDESSNPTGSFKARGLSAAISKAKELGVKKVIIPTAGNAGGAMAAYAARAGLKAHIFMPKDTPYANIEESRMAGAEVILVDGLISDAAGMAGEKARAEGWFDVSTFKEPYRVEGKKVMGYELAEYLWLGAARRDHLSRQVAEQDWSGCGRHLPNWRS